MLKRLATLFFACVTTIAWVGCGRTTSHFVYAAIPGTNQVAAYRQDPNSGVLTSLAGSPFATGTAPQALALHPSKKFLYIANSGENDISRFTISSKGALTEVTPRTQAGQTPVVLVMDSAGSFLYVGNSGSMNISVFSIDAGSGALTEVSQSPFPIGLAPLNMKLSPSGAFLYATGSSGLVEAFTVNAGVLKILGIFQTNGVSPYGLAIDPAGTYLYTANFASNSISEFTIASDGTLAPMATSPLGGASLTAPISLLIDPSGKYLYVANDISSGSLAAFSIGSGGVLTPLTSSPFGGGNQPNAMAVDAGGKYLLVGSQSNSIQVFKRKSSDGTLSSISTYSTGGTPTSIAVLQ
jgi:6-phosphogluconolactonase